MKENIIVEVIGRDKYIIKSGSQINDLVKQMSDSEYIIAAIIDNELVELSYRLNCDTKLGLITVNERAGQKIYQNGLKYLYTTAIKELYGLKSNVEIKHSIDKGIYTEIDINKPLTQEIVDEIKNKMLELSNKDLNIEKISTSRKSAIKYFADLKEKEKVENYKQMTNENVTLYQLMHYYNYFYGAMPVSTKILNKFELTLISNKGIVLAFPKDFNKKTPKYEPVEKVLEEFRTYHQWAERIGISYACDINNMIINEKIYDFIQLNEMKHQRDIENIAREIAKNKNVRLVLIGGPSSSGKTTTSKKLSLCLKEKGIKTFVLSLDDYYKNISNMPKDENGNYERDRIEAFDTILLNNQLEDLLMGKPVKMPTYDFVAGEKVYKNPKVQLDSKTIILMEGIHTLNEKLTKDIDRKLKYKLYISPFTPLNLDRHNHISTTDLRLLRRMIRDNRTRGSNAENTLELWKKVRDTEDIYIFPYQNECDIVLNTALVHEIGMLKLYAIPLLYSVKETSPHYREAIRMINFLKCFISIPSEKLPNTSILREFIGDSYFK